MSMQGRTVARNELRPRNFHSVIHSVAREVAAFAFPLFIGLSIGLAFMMLATLPEHARFWFGLALLACLIAALVAVLVRAWIEEQR